MGKSDRAFLFGLLALLGGIGVPFGRWVTWMLSGMAVLLVCTIINRARRAVAETSATR